MWTFEGVGWTRLGVLKPLEQVCDNSLTYDRHDKEYHQISRCLMDYCIAIEQSPAPETCYDNSEP